MQNKNLSFHKFLFVKITSPYRQQKDSVSGEQTRPRTCRVRDGMFALQFYIEKEKKLIPYINKITINYKSNGNTPFGHVPNANTFILRIT